jgi:hypothetical protein
MKVVKTERSTLYFMSYRYKIYFGRHRTRSGVVDAERYPLYFLLYV